jgi:tetratricopeptide (TPR) repeat protein
MISAVLRVVGVLIAAAPISALSPQALAQATPPTPHADWVCPNGSDGGDGAAPNCGGGGGSGGGNAALNAAAAAAGTRARQAFDDWLSGAAAARAQAARGNQANDQGIAAYNAKNWDQAVAYFRQAVALNPNPVTRNNLANALVSKVWETRDAFGAEAATAATLQEALTYMAPDNPSRAAVISQIDSLRTALQTQQQQKDRDRLAQQADVEAAGAIRQTLAQAAAAAKPKNADAGRPALAFMDASGSSGGLGMAAAAPQDVGPERSSKTITFASASAQVNAAAASGADAKDSLPKDPDRAKAQADCVFGTNGADCHAATPLTFISGPPSAYQADALSKALGPAAANPAVKAALDSYRNSEQNIASAKKDIAAYQSTIDAGGDGVVKAKLFKESAEAKLKTYELDRDKAKSEVSKTLVNLGVALPPELSGPATPVALPATASTSTPSAGVTPAAYSTSAGAARTTQ